MCTIPHLDPPRHAATRKAEGQLFRFVAFLKPLSLPGRPGVELVNPPRRRSYEFPFDQEVGNRLRRDRLPRLVGMLIARVDPRVRVGLPLGGREQIETVIARRPADVYNHPVDRAERIAITQLATLSAARGPQERKLSGASPGRKPTSPLRRTRSAPGLRGPGRQLPT
jgi:hypothetical protein